MAKFSDDIVNAVHNEEGKTVDLGSDISLNGKAYRKIDIPSNKDIEALNFNADILIDPEHPTGMQLFGAASNSGLTIRNRTDIAPYHYYATDGKMMLLNNKYEVVHELDIAATYGDTILKYFLGDVFENVLVVSPRYLYVLSYDLQLKAKITLAYTVNEKQDEKGIYWWRNPKTGQDIFSDIGIELHTYPFNNSITINCKETPMSTSGRVVTRLRKKSLGHITAVFKQQCALDYQGKGIAFNYTTAQLFTETNPLLYNGNLYIPYGNDVVKLLFHCDSQEDVTKGA